MDKNTPILIERTANGWLVRPQTEQHGLLCWSDCHVFQNMAYDDAGCTSEKTLWGFLERHFTK